VEERRGLERKWWMMEPPWVGLDAGLCMRDWLGYLEASGAEDCEDFLGVRHCCGGNCCGGDCFGGDCCGGDCCSFLAVVFKFLNCCVSMSLLLFQNRLYTSQTCLIPISSHHSFVREVPFHCAIFPLLILHFILLLSSIALSSQRHVDPCCTAQNTSMMITNADRLLT
jgi:hypothetical protein